ncbi:facilitated trehalose transporter Tret1-2 homolog [Bacillus rossius redtenbacheri]|uniref:facilitated trehalose transporter Tret1-2 homolog n=1 Tax=Bacillus rossius redtenbacheri TaxID=93214 RepID=UPI002FDCDDE2
MHPAAPRSCKQTRRSRSRDGRNAVDDRKSYLAKFARRLARRDGVGAGGYKESARSCDRRPEQTEHRRLARQAGRADEKNGMESVAKDAVEQQGGKTSGRRLRQYLAASAVNLAAFANGAVVGWPSPALAALQSDASPVGVAPMTDDAASWLGSLMCLGSLVAAPAYGRLCSRHSRKTTGYLVALQGVVGWALVATATSEATLFFGRFMLGVAGAGATMLCPQYVAETAEPEVRGTLCSFLALFGNCGVLFAYALGSVLPYQQFCLCCLATFVAFALAFAPLPESPVYLAAAGRHVEALRALEWLRVSGGLPAPDVTPRAASSLKDVLSRRGTRRALLVGVGLMVNNQLSGILAVVSYAGAIFRESGGELSPQLSTVLVGALQLFGVYLTSYLVDRAGRKALLMASNAVAAASLLLLGLYFNLRARGVDVSGFGWAPVACLCAYVVGVALGVGSVPFVVISEIFPPEAKGFATAVCICVLNGLAFLVARFFLPLARALGMDGCYWLCASCCVASVFFCHFVVPETKNRSLEKIIEELNGHNGSKDAKENLAGV